jgi:hypothetical protein
VRAAFVLAAVAGSACSREAAIVVMPAWPADQAVILVPVDAELHPLENAPIWVPPGAPTSSFKLSSGERFRVYALAYSSSVSANFESCGVTFSGSGAPLTPSPVWSTPLESAEPGLMLTFSTTTTPPFSSQIHYTDPTCVMPVTKCDSAVGKIQVRGTPLPAAGGYDIFSLARVSATEILAGTANDTKSGDDGAVYRVSADGEATPVAIPGQAGSAFQVAYDGKNTVFGVTTHGTYFQLDRSGGLGFAVQAGFSNGGSRIHSGRDGFTVSFEPAGVHELTPGSTVARSRPDFPPSGDLFVVTATRIAAISDGGIWFYDGHSWVEEYRGPEAVLPPLGLYSTRGLAGNAHTFVFAYNVATGSGVLVRDEATHAWAPLGTSPFHLPIQAALALGHGNVLLLGQSGDAALWLASQGAPWCPIATGTNEDFLSVAASPDELSAVANQGETTPDLGPRLITFSLPPL